MYILNSKWTAVVLGQGGFTSTARCMCLSSECGEGMLGMTMLLES